MVFGGEYLDEEPIPGSQIAELDAIVKSLTKSSDTRPFKRADPSITSEPSEA
jgi:hypothetical protein